MNWSYFCLVSVARRICMLLDVSENLQVNPLAFGTISEYIEVKTQIFSNTINNLELNGHFKTTTHRKLTLCIFQLQDNFHPQSQKRNFKTVLIFFENFLQLRL